MGHRSACATANRSATQSVRAAGTAFCRAATSATTTTSSFARRKNPSARGRRASCPRSRSGPAEAGTLPFQYALSDAAPMYARIPKKSEQTKMEGWLAKPGAPDRAALWRRARRTRHRGSYPGSRTSSPVSRRPCARARLYPRRRPYLVRKIIPNGSMLSFSKSFEVEGRTWLLTPDLALVPADRVRPFRATVFHGVSSSSGPRPNCPWPG